LDFGGVEGHFWVGLLDEAVEDWERYCSSSGRLGVLDDWRTYLEVFKNAGELFKTYEITRLHIKSDIINMLGADASPLFDKSNSGERFWVSIIIASRKQRI
jgi:hypothetical protein